MAIFLIEIKVVEVSADQTVLYFCDRSDGDWQGRILVESIHPVKTAKPAPRVDVGLQSYLCGMFYVYLGFR